MTISLVSELLPRIPSPQTVDKRWQNAHKPLGLHDLIALLWPEESILPEAAANRGYNTIALLRKAGLRALIIRRKSGYLIDPTVTVVTAHDVEAPNPGS